MDAQKVDMFILSNSKYFEDYQIRQLREQLILLDNVKWVDIQATQFKDPTTILIVSILAGQLGIDRFLIGDTGLGVLKLLTCGGLGIWTIIDWFMIMGATKDKNMEKLRDIILGE